MQTHNTEISILIVEDDPLQNQLLTAFIESQGHIVRSAYNGSDAESLFNAHAPDIIFLDYELPDTNGQVLLRRLRDQASRWLPIVFLSAHSAPDIQRQCLMTGADDFISKPFDFPLLEAKLTAVVRVAQLQKHIHWQNGALSMHVSRAQEENEAAKYLYDRLIRGHQVSPSFCEQRVIPAEGFSGDLLAFNKGPNGHFYWLLADATGHGLTAAISLIPVTQVFYAMTQKGHHLSAIMAEMHRQLRRYTPAHRFVCATAVAIDPAHNNLMIWNGGMPDVYVFNTQGIQHRLFSRHMPLGLQGPSGFDDTVEHHTYSTGARLFACSDGLPEACNVNEESFGESRLLSTLLIPDRHCDLSDMYRALAEFLGDQKPLDDIALLLVTLPEQAHTLTEHTNATDVSLLQACRWQIQLSGAHLKAVDPIPMAVAWLEQMHIRGGKFAFAHTVLQELVSNAIDHGLLRLSSALKEGDDGFSRYLEARQERLNQLQDGELFIQLELAPLPSSWSLRIHIKDSGEGYAFATHPTSENTAKRHGRGLLLVHSLSTAVKIIAPGNETIAIIEL